MRTRFEQWRESHDGTKYPFEDNCSLVTESERQLELGTFLDAAIYPVGAVVGLRITSCLLGVDTGTIYIGTTDEPQLCSGTFSLVSPAEELRLADSLNRNAGVLVTSPIRLSGLQAWGVGEHVFPEGAASFVSSAVFPMPQVGVYGLQLDDGTILSGDVWLVGDDGVVLDCDYVDVPTGCGEVQRQYLIRVHAVGDPLYRRKLCAPDRFEAPRFLQQITFQKGAATHVCRPSSNGDIKIGAASLTTPDTTLRIYPSDRGLVFEAVGEKLGSSGG